MMAPADWSRYCWIKDIATFNAEGFKLRDVNVENCEDIDAVPAGSPIPPDAGEPPKP